MPKSNENTKSLLDQIIDHMLENLNNFEDFDEKTISALEALASKEMLSSNKKVLKVIGQVEQGNTQ